MLLREALSRLLGRVVTLDEIGLTNETAFLPDAWDWDADTLFGLTDLGRVDLDVDRRGLLETAAYSIAALSLPGEPWWDRMKLLGRSGRGAGATKVGRGDVDAVRDTVSMFPGLISVEAVVTHARP